MSLFALLRAIRIGANRLRMTRLVDLFTRSHFRGRDEKMPPCSLVTSPAYPSARVYASWVSIKIAKASSSNGEAFGEHVGYNLKRCRAALSHCEQAGKPDAEQGERGGLRN